MSAAGAGAGAEAGTNARRCAYFLEDVSTESGFTTRRADQIIHSLYGISMSPMNMLQAHKDLQQTIILEFAGCEKAIFNDPRIKYPHRDHFRGTTGTMSNILTSGYFLLYDYLLNGNFGIEVNVFDDYIILFYQVLSLQVAGDVFIIDGDEFEAIKRILVKFQSMIPRDLLFTNAWFREYVDFLRNTHREALEHFTYYRNNPERQTVEAAIEWKESRVPKPQKEILRHKLFVPSGNHMQYEYHPPYIKEGYFRIPLLPFLEKLDVVRRFFSNPDSVGYIDISPGASNRARGGTRRKRILTRKGKKRSGRRAPLSK
jgi:hypothetical protein